MAGCSPWRYWFTNKGMAWGPLASSICCVSLGSALQDIMSIVIYHQNRGHLSSVTYPTHPVGLQSPANLRREERRNAKLLEMCFRSSHMLMYQRHQLPGSNGLKSCAHVTAGWPRNLEQMTTCEHH